jgi:hypothetical protein
MHVILSDFQFLNSSVIAGTRNPNSYCEMLVWALVYSSYNCMHYVVRGCTLQTFWSEARETVKTDRLLAPSRSYHHGKYLLTNFKKKSLQFSVITLLVVMWYIYIRAVLINWLDKLMYKFLRERKDCTEWILTRSACLQSN